VEITEIRVKLMDEKGTGNERLQAFCSITFDNMFVVRDLKIIGGTKGQFVAMPSRKLMDRCPDCGCKNHLRARYCNQCGHFLGEDRAPRDCDGRAKLHADIAHPINSTCREFIQSAIIRAYLEEIDKAKLPGYVCRYDELDVGEDIDTYESVITMLDRAQEVRRHPGHDLRGTPARPAALPESLAVRRRFGGRE
jgi:stage V sporulation protein G